MKINAKSSSRVKPVTSLTNNRHKTDPLKVQELEAIIEDTKEQVFRFSTILDQKERELFLERAKPFKEGDRVLAEIPCGRVRKEKECELVLEKREVLGYTFKLAPLNADGSLSSRTFLVYESPVEFSRVFKLVK